MIKYGLVLLALLNIAFYAGCQNNDINPHKIKLKVNYSVINKDSLPEKLIIQQWENYLNSSTGNYYNDQSMLFWERSDEFPWPNFYLSSIGKNKEEVGKDRDVSVIALYPLRGGNGVYILKSMFYVYKSITKTVELDYIAKIYVVPQGNSFKFLSSAQWYAQKWKTKMVGNITYYYPSEHIFDIGQASKLDSFNTNISKLFRHFPIKFKYFLCESNAHLSEVFGYEFMPDQYIPNQSGGSCDIGNSAIFAGNGTEYYPHELVHLYTSKYWSDNGFHSWFDEGIAALFGGSRGYPVEWHLKKLKIFLEQHPEERLNNIFKLTTIPNGEQMTEYDYAIGGLICKRVYEKEGMNGLFDLLKSGAADDDFYKAIEKHFGVKKADFGTFIRDELKKINK
jgi:hypothetical protein